MEGACVYGWRGEEKEKEGEERKKKRENREEIIVALISQLYQSIESKKNVITL